MLAEWLRLRDACGARPGVNVRHAADVERRLSTARAVLAVSSLAALVLEHQRGMTLFGVATLGGFALYSSVLAVEIHRRPRNAAPPVLLLHLGDVAWAMAVLAGNWGVEGPFIGYYLFTLLAAGFRWGLLETAATGAFAIVATVSDAALRWWLPTPSVDWHIVAVHSVYLVVATVLVGYMAEDDRRHREQTWAASDLLDRMRTQTGLVASVRNVLDTLMRQLCARRAVFAIAEEGRDQVYLWEAEADAGGGRASVRLRQHARAACGTWLFQVPPAAAGWEAVRGRAGEQARVTAIDASGERVRAHVEVAPLLQAPFAWSEVLCLTSIAGEGWEGRLFLFDPALWRPADHNLRFLHVVVGRVAPALLNLYLQRRLESRSGVLDRANISRQLHDGVIQSLIGVEMHIDVLRRQATPTSGAAVELDGIQHVLADEILNLRDLMQVLKPADVSPDRLVEHLVGEVAHFRNRTRIDARLSCTEDEIDLSPRVCREMAGVVREALANVRKHSGASSVVVRLARRDTDWLLTIEDNGRGFGFDGTLGQDELDARHLGPAIIAERVRALGGRFSLWSRPGEGARLDIIIPGRHHA